MAKQSFETALKQLEQIVKELEGGELPLESAMKKFEDGIQLSRFCARKLDETEQRITMLLQEPSGVVQETAFADGVPDTSSSGDGIP